jgi:hypothetical protein
MMPCSCATRRQPIPHRSRFLHEGVGLRGGGAESRRAWSG